MTATVLRPVPTFEQVIRMPDPIIEKPDRVIQVSRPDPDIFAEHAEALGDLSGGIHVLFCNILIHVYTYLLVEKL